jgi:putative peptidoglycan lipid II flippase
MTMLSLKRLFQKLINFESKTISGGAFIIAFFYLLNGGLALLRNGLLASYFGASRMLDIYWASFRIPDLIYVIFISGALSAGFIPLFAEKLNRSKEEAVKMANNILSTIIVLLFIVAVLVLIFAPIIAPLIVPGFDKDAQNQVAKFLRIMMFQPIILGVSAILSGVLQTFRRFFITSLSPIFYNLGIILGIIFLTKIFGPIGLALSVLLGAFLHLAILLPSLKNIDFKIKFLPSFKSENIRQLFSIAGPRTLSLISTQINFLVITIIASNLEKGKLAIFNFANDLQSLPQNIFAISFAISAFPILSSLALDNQRFTETVIKTLKNILLFLIPIAAFYFVFQKQIVLLTLRYGHFDLKAVNETALILGILSLGMIASGLLPLLIRTFFAKKDAIRPFIAGITANVFNILLSLILVSRYGIKGIAFAFVVSNYLNLGLLIFMLYRKNIVEKTKNIWLSFGNLVFKILLISFLSAILSGLYLKFLAVNSTAFIINLVQIIIGGIIFALVYFVFGYFLMKEEFLNFWNNNPLLKRFNHFQNEKHS